MKRMKETARVRCLKHKEEILAAIAAGHTLKALRRSLGWLDIPESTFCRHVRRLEEDDLAKRTPATKLSSTPAPASDPVNLASSSYTASISRIEEIEFTPARKGDAERLFKRAKKTDEWET